MKPLLYRVGTPAHHIVATCTGSATFRQQRGKSCWHTVCALCQQSQNDRGGGWLTHRAAVAGLARHLRDDHGTAL